MDKDMIYNANGLLDIYGGDIKDLIPWTIRKQLSNGLELNLQGYVHLKNAVDSEDLRVLLENLGAGLESHAEGFIKHWRKD